MDCSGGLGKDSFYLKNGVFFNNYTKGQTIFKKPLGNNKPDIDFTTLPLTFAVDVYGEIQNKIILYKDNLESNYLLFFFF
jgi:hypothetical protein